jgi:hypothetical protein
MSRVVDTRFVSIDVPEGYSELVVHRPYSMHTTGSLLPQRLDIRWEKVNDDGWQLIRLSVTGPRVKKDGTVGLVHATTFFKESGRTWQHDIPEWITTEVNKWHPKGDKGNE